jgi:hypothetical protein
MNSLITFLSTLSLLHWLFITLIALFIYLTSLFRRCLWHSKKEERLYLNLQRPAVMINASETTDFTSAFKDLKEFLTKVGLFNIPEDIGTAQRFDHSAKTNYSLIILAYDPKLKDWSKIFRSAEARNIPVIIYTFGQHLDREIMSEIKRISSNYSHITHANNHLSLTNSLFTILATFPTSK